MLRRVKRRGLHVGGEHWSTVLGLIMSVSYNIGVGLIMLVMLQYWSRANQSEEDNEKTEEKTKIEALHGLKWQPTGSLRSRGWGWGTFRFFLTTNLELDGGGGGGGASL